MHFGATNAALILAGLAALQGRRGLVPAIVAAAYSIIWASHFLIERNRPATFGHPLWSLRGDFRMWSMMWRGRDSELQRLALGGSAT